MHDLDTFANEPLVVAGRKIDGGTIDAKRFRTLATELASQLQRDPNAAERVLLVNAAIHTVKVRVARLCPTFAWAGSGSQSGAFYRTARHDARLA